MAPLAGMTTPPDSVLLCISRLNFYSDQEIRDIVTNWANQFSDGDSESFAAMYTPSAVYRDHAFQLTRIGRGAIKEHYEIWLQSNPDFTMKIDHFQRTAGGASIRFTARGTFKNDISTVVATGTSFEYRGVVDLILNDEGKVEQTDEYYSKNWFEGVELERYNLRELL